jgi:hypothetical protein
MKLALFRVAAQRLGKKRVGLPEGERKLPVFLEAAELAAMLKVSERTLENWRLGKKGPFFIRMGEGGRAKVIYSLDVVLKWLKTQEGR